jgi:hypothetical protein
VNEGIPSQPDVPAQCASQMCRPNVPADTSMKTFMLQIAVSRRLMAKLKIKNQKLKNYVKLN